MLDRPNLPDRPKATINANASGLAETAADQVIFTFPVKQWFSIIYFVLASMYLENSEGYRCSCRPPCF